MLVSMKVKEGKSEVEGASHTHRVTNKVMNDYVESNVVRDAVNEKNEVMNLNQNLVVDKRTIVVIKKSRNIY